MVKRAMVWMLGAAMLLVSPVASGQDRFRMESKGPTTVHVQHLSGLLRLDAPTHELLVELHTEMFQTEELAFGEFRSHYTEGLEAEPPDYDRIYRAAEEYGDQHEEAAATFYRDAKLLVKEDGVVLVEHVERRLHAERLIEQEGYDISGLAAHPFELLFREKLIDDTRFAELLAEHGEADRRLGEMMEDTVEAMQALYDLYADFDFDIANANARQIRDIGRALNEELDRATRLRAANEGLAQSIIDSLDEENSTRYEQAWLLANYKDVQRERLAEIAANRALADPGLNEQTRTAIEGMRASFGERLRIARKMARVAKHRSDLAFTMQNLLDETEPDTSLYESGLERIDGVADSYAAALEGVLTQEQRVKYGLDVEGVR